ncbi:hypothetical protein GCM10012285_46870 [Streptomyces kronopolitis]|uniref:Uncharacterized protein n=1 Tax=Streptomyces kronopolitis TaxID=1612435 RepID=A0ABQ2JQH9_9ACTN|nr:hypothetical protein GCM10012285_46870 [Streptomyces kronopolitis]
MRRGRGGAGPAGLVGRARTLRPRVVRVDAGNRVVDLGADPSEPAPGAAGRLPPEAVGAPLAARRGAGVQGAAFPGGGPERGDEPSSRAVAVGVPRSGRRGRVPVA